MQHHNITITGKLKFKNANKVCLRFHNHIIYTSKLVTRMFYVSLCDLRTLNVVILHIIVSFHACRHMLSNIWPNLDSHQYMHSFAPLSYCATICAFISIQPCQCCFANYVMLSVTSYISRSIPNLHT